MRLVTYVSFGVVFLVILGIFLRLNLIKVPIGQVGVLTTEFGPGKGLVEKDYGPGFWLDLGPLHSWETFDTTVQTLSMLATDPTGALKVKSADGQTVTLDVTVKYRIQPEKCWLLRKELGVGDSYKNKVRNEAVDALLPIFGTMFTDDFYNPEKRAEKSAEAERFLASRLERYYVELISILVRDVTFTPIYEQQIKAKALKGQEREVNEAQREAAKYRGDTQKIVAETAAKVTVIEQNLEKTRRELTAENEKLIAKIRADADKFVKETRADADLYKAQKTADATRLLENAKAEAQRLRQMALQGSGAKNLVALEAAEHLNLTKVVISTMDNNVLDLPAFAKKLGASGLTPTTTGN